MAAAANTQDDELYENWAQELTAKKEEEKREAATITALSQI